MTKNTSTTLNKLGRKVEGLSSLEARFGRFICRKGVNKSFLIEGLRQWADINYVSEKDLRVMVHQINQDFTWGDEYEVTSCTSKTAVEVILDDIENDRGSYYGIVPKKGLIRGTIPAHHAGFDFGSKNERKVLSYKRKSSRINYIQKTLDRLGVDLTVLK